MPDTPTPGTADANASKAPNSPRDAGQGPAADQSSPNTQLAAALEENRKLRERYDNAQQVLARQGAELGRLRKQPASAPSGSGYDYGYPDDGPAAAETPVGADHPMVQRIALNDQRLDLIQYRQEVPNWADFQPDIDTLLNDKVRAYEVAAWKPDGFGGVSVDWYRTYRNAKNLVELERFRSAQTDASKTQQSHGEQRKTLQAMATMSGTSATEGDREIRLDDIHGKSAAEIAELARQAGLLPEHDKPTLPKRQ